MRKNILPSFHLVSAQNMGASFTSDPTNIQYLDNVGLQINFSDNSTPVGVFSVQISIDYEQDQNDNVINPGNWASLPPTASTSNGSPIVIDLNQLSAPWIRIVYTRSSGGASDAFDAYITAKMI